MILRSLNLKIHSSENPRGSERLIFFPFKIKEMTPTITKIISLKVFIPRSTPLRFYPLSLTFMNVNNLIMKFFIRMKRDVNEIIN